MAATMAIPSTKRTTTVCGFGRIEPKMDSSLLEKYPGTGDCIAAPARHGTANATTTVLPTKPDLTERAFVKNTY